MQPTKGRCMGCLIPSYYNEIMSHPPPTMQHHLRGASPASYNPNGMSIDTGADASNALGPASAAAPNNNGMATAEGLQGTLKKETTLFVKIEVSFWFFSFAYCVRSAYSCGFFFDRER